MQPIQQNPSPARHPVIRRGRQLLCLVAELPAAAGKHRPSKLGETRAEAKRRGLLPAPTTPALRAVRLDRVGGGDHELLSAWAALSCLPNNRREIACALWLVLERTTAEDTRCVDALPALRPGIDLRPWLADRERLAELLAKLNPGDEICDPRALLQWRERVDIREVRFAGTFAATLLPFVHGGDRATALVIEELSLAMDIAEKPRLVAWLAELLRTTPSPTALLWIRCLSEEVEARRELLAEELVRSGCAAAVVPDRALRSALRTMRRWADDDGCDARLADEFRMLLRGSAGGAKAKYLLCGLRLARELACAVPAEIYAGIGAPPQRVLDFVATHEYPQRKIQLWLACGRLPGLERLLAKLELKRYRPEDIIDFIGLLRKCRGALPIGAKERGGWTRWERFGSLGDELCARFFRVAPARRADFADYIAALRDSLALLIDEELHGQYLRLGALLCGRYSNAGRTAKALRAVVLIARVGNQIEALQRLPDSTFAKLVKACASTNRGPLLENGLARIALGDPVSALQGLAFCPSLTLEFAKALGAPPREVASRVARVYREHPLVGADIGAMQLAEAAALVDGVATFRNGEGVPRPLREHLAGTNLLRADRMAYYRGELVKNAVRLRLTVFSELLEAELRRAAVGRANAPLPLHTVLFAHHIDENERALRWFLQQRVWGGTDGRLEHPSNRRWIESSATRFDVGAWLGKLEVITGVAALGQVTLRIEDDPDEVLKLGSYVGSCLGLGGMFSHSAVAALLDANKRVVYARNRRGRVVGRQLLAVSKTAQLVCFEIYGNAPEHLQMAFGTFDRCLAEFVGLPLLYQQREYEIETLVAQEWYDDGAWDFRVGA